jgi:hypothetical protein
MCKQLEHWNLRYSCTIRVHIFLGHIIVIVVSLPMLNPCGYAHVGSREASLENKAD